MIPKFHNAFAPALLDINLPIDDIATVKLTAGNKTITFEVEVLSQTNTVDIQKYVRALMKTGQQSLRYNVKVNDVDYGTYTATRSAQQIGENNNIENRVNKVLTDRKKLKVYDGYPCEVSLLLGEPTNDIMNINISCDDSEISTILLYSAAYTKPICQKETLTFSATYFEPICQKIDETELITYTAMWVTPICQKEQQVLPPIEITLGYRLEGQNTLYITWNSSYNFSQIIDVDLEIELNLGIQGLDMHYGTIPITGSTGSVAVSTRYSRIYEVMRIEVLDFNPKVIDGRNVLIYGMD